jgi:peptidyl-prolyl cis-trans isomerase C
MFRTKIAFILLFIMVAAIAGCGGDGKKESGKSMDNPMTSGADFVAKVDGVVIADKEVSQELAMLRQQMAGRVSAEQLNSMEPMLKQQAVANLVNRTLLTQAADRENITVTDEQVDAKYDEIKGNFPDEETFIAQLGRSNMTPDEFRVEVERGLKLEELVGFKTAGAGAPTEEEAREFYDSNTERFSTPERIRTSHILIKVEETDSEIVREQKKAKIEELHARLVAGEDIATLATENSDCPSKSKGGDLGFFGRGQMVKPFEDAAFALEPGEISPVVETNFGYHVIEVTEKEESSVTSFEDARDSIIDYLADMKKQDEMNSYMSSLRESAEIEYTDSALAGARLFFSLHPPEIARIQAFAAEVLRSGGGKARLRKRDAEGRVRQVRSSLVQGPRRVVRRLHGTEAAAPVRGRCMGRPRRAGPDLP